MTAMKPFTIPNAPLRGGVTYAQAMAVLERFCSGEFCWAPPTIADRLGIGYETVCKVLDGQLWPQARQIWMDRVLP